MTSEDSFRVKPDHDHLVTIDNFVKTSQRFMSLAVSFRKKDASIADVLLQAHVHITVNVWQVVTMVRVKFRLYLLKLSEMSINCGHGI